MGSSETYTTGGETTGRFRKIFRFVYFEYVFIRVININIKVYM